MQKSSKYSDLSKNTILFTINSFGSRIISFLLVPLYTYVLATEEYGIADLMTSTSLLLIPLLTLNIQDAVLRFSLDKSKDRKDVFTIAVALNAMASTILAVTLLLIRQLTFLKIEDKYYLFLFFSFLTGSIFNSLQMYVKAIDKVKILVISGLSSTLISCVANLLFLLVFKLGINGYLIANVIGHLSAIVIMAVGGNLLAEIHRIKNINTVKEMLVFSVPLIINSVAWWINTASDKYIISFFCGAAINGIYTVAYKIPTILSTLQSVFYNAWSVSAITEFDKDDKDGFIGNIYSLYSLVSTIGCSAILLLNIPISKLLYSKEYFDAWHCVPFLLIGVVFNGLSLFEGCLFTAVKQSKKVSKTTLIGSVVNTILNFSLIPILGYMGAAFATMFGYFIVWMLRTVELKKIIVMKVDWRTQFLVFVVLSFQTILALNPSFCTYTIQFIIFVVIILLQYKYTSRIFEMIKKRFKH